MTTVLLCFAVLVLCAIAFLSGVWVAERSVKDELFRTKSLTHKYKRWALTMAHEANDLAAKHGEMQVAGPGLLLDLEQGDPP